MKKLLDKWISISLIKRIIGGLALGIILGLLVPKASGIALFGSVFVGALKAIAPLLVFVLVISSLCHSGKSHGGVIKTVIILYMFSTILASVIAVFTSKLFPVTLTLTEGIEEMSSPGSIGDVFNSLLMNIVENPITSLTKANYVGILAWAVVIGIACRHAKESTKDMLVDISNGLSKVVTWIINFAPFGIKCLHKIFSYSSGVIPCENDYCKAYERQHPVKISRRVSHYGHYKKHRNNAESRCYLPVMRINEFLLKG